MQQAVEDRTYSVEEFLAAYEGREGRYELVDGRVVKMPAETLGHVRVKFRVGIALDRAIRKAGVRAEVLPDGISLKIADDRAREPDVLVVLDEGLPARSMLVWQPLIAVEVLSPTSARTDTVHKLAEYFTFPSLAHYLVVDPEARRVTHHARRADGRVEAATYAEGAVALAPPGITLTMSELWPDEAR